MTTRTATRASRRLWWIGAIVGIAGVLTLVYAVWAAYLALMSSEGALPPHSQLPEVPNGARVLSETELCASGGCWRELVVRPAPGQSPNDLAAEMGVAEEERHSWRLLDPHSVVVGSTVSGGTVRIYVQY